MQKTSCLRSYLLAKVTLNRWPAHYLNKILVTPWIGELVIFPTLIDSQEGQMIALWLEEFGSLLICLGLLFPGPVHSSKHRPHDQQQFCRLVGTRKQQQQVATN